MEELASFGYVCVACDFPYDATLVVYPDDEKAEFLFMEIPDNVTPTQVTSSCRPGAGPELQGGLGDCDHPVLALGRPVPERNLHNSSGPTAPTRCRLGGSARAVTAFPDTNPPRATPPRSCWSTGTSASRCARTTCTSSAASCSRWRQTQATRCRSCWTLAACRCWATRTAAAPW